MTDPNATPATGTTDTSATTNADTGTTAALPAAAPAIDPITARLLELKVEPAIIAKIMELGAESVEDLSEIKVEDLTAFGMKPIPAKKLVAAFKASMPAAPVVSAPGAFAPVSFDYILPSVPSEDSWLAALKVGGVLKVDESTVISAVRAALAERVGLFSALDRIVERMEEFAESSEEQVDASFFKIREEMTRRNYGDLFNAVPGFTGKYVTEARKKVFFQKVDKIFWPAIIGFNQQLASWMDTWNKGSANPAAALNAIAAMVGGGGVGMMPPGMMAPPETGMLRDSADAVADAVNKVFAGVGTQISAAVGFEASKIRTMLQDGKLAALTGFPNRDQMIKQLGLAVPATYPRLETNLTRFVLGVLQVKNQPDGPAGNQYFGGLYMLGGQIQWDQLTNDGSRSSSRPLSGIGGDRPFATAGSRRRDRDFDDSDK
jgi:hypothetical protein